MYYDPQFRVILKRFERNFTAQRSLMSSICAFSTNLCRFTESRLTSALYVCTMWCGANIMLGITLISYNSNWGKLYLAPFLQVVNFLCYNVHEVIDLANLMYGTLKSYIGHSVVYPAV